MLSLYSDIPAFDIFDTFKYLNDFDRQHSKRRPDTIDEAGLKIEMPGVAASDLNITVDNRHLKISGKSRHGKEFTYTYTLKAHVDEASITAKLKDGLLEVSLPRRSDAVPRKIDILAE